MADDVGSLYPRPPVQQPSLASNPLALIDVIGKLNQNALFQQQFHARKAIGDAYQKAIRPDGSIDTPTLMQEIQRNPQAGFMAGEAAAGALARQGQQISNTAAATELQMKQNRFIADAVGSLDPNSDKSAVIDRLVAIKRNIPSIPSQMITSAIKELNSIDDKTPEGKATLAAKIGQLRDFAIGTTGLATPTQGGYVQGGPQAGSPVSVPLQTYLKGGGAVTAPPPGSEKSAAVMQEDLAAARNFGQEMLPLGQALDAANKLKEKYGTGYFAPGSEGRQEFQSFFYGLSPTLSRWLGVDPEKLKNYAEAKKYLTQATAGRVGGFGAGTEAQLKAAYGGSPSVNINDMAVEDVLKMMITARRMEHVQTLQNSGAGPIGYTASAAKWATQQDPRAYGIDLMSPAQIETLNKSLKPGSPAREKFNASLKAAIDSGALPPPGNNNAAQ